MRHLCAFPWERAWVRWGWEGAQMRLVFLCSSANKDVFCWHAVYSTKLTIRYG